MQWRQGPAALASNIMVGTDGVGVGRRFDSETPQGLAVLTERPNMGMNDSEVLDPGAGHSRKTVVHLLEVLADDLQGREWHPVVDLGDRLSRRRSFRSAAWPSACRPPPLPGRHPRRRRTAGPSRTEMSQASKLRVGTAHALEGDGVVTGHRGASAPDASGMKLFVCVAQRCGFRLHPGQRNAMSRRKDTADAVLVSADRCDSHRRVNDRHRQVIVPVRRERSHPRSVMRVSITRAARMMSPASR